MGAGLWKGNGAWRCWCGKRLRGGEILEPELSAKSADTGWQTRCAQTEPPCTCNAAISSSSISNHPCRCSPPQHLQAPVHRLPHMLARGVEVDGRECVGVPRSEALVGPRVRFWRCYIGWGDSVSGGREAVGLGCICRSPWKYLGRWFLRYS